MRFRNPKSGDGFAAWLDSTKGKSGVYVFRSFWGVQYVGESHTGNLYKTITRHFFGWSDRTGRPHYTVGLFPVEVAVKLTRAADARDEQDRLIRRLRPAHNKAGQPDDVPF